MLSLTAVDIPSMSPRNHAACIGSAGGSGSELIRIQNVSKRT
jgi:hypothetical protein